MLRLLFGEKARKGDNISIDLLLRYRHSLAVFLGHGRACYDFSEAVMHRFNLGDGNGRS